MSINEPSGQKSPVHWEDVDAKVVCFLYGGEAAKCCMQQDVVNIKADNLLHEQIQKLLREVDVEFVSVKKRKIKLFAYPGRILMWVANWRSIARRCGSSKRLRRREDACREITSETDFEKTKADREMLQQRVLARENQEY